MTETGTFIINGAERVIVSQLVRSPSVYFSTKVDKNAKNVYRYSYSNRGAWLELEMDAKDVVYVRIDRTRKIPVTVLLRALGFGTDAEILDLLGNDEYIRNTLDKDNTDSTEKALIEIYERLRPGEPPTLDNAKSLLVARFFDPKRYDLANVGRYKINKSFTSKIVCSINVWLSLSLILKLAKLSQKQVKWLTVVCSMKSCLIWRRVLASVRIT